MGLGTETVLIPSEVTGRGTRNVDDVLHMRIGTIARNCWRTLAEKTTQVKVAEFLLCARSVRQSVLHLCG